MGLWFERRNIKSSPCVKVPEKEAERLRRAALEQAKSGQTPAADKPAQVAALPVDANKTALTPQEINRSLQAELRRDGCQTGAVNDEWNSASRRSLELFNKHAGMKLDAKLASLDALDAVKSKQARICRELGSLRLRQPSRASAWQASTALI